MPAAAAEIESSLDEDATEAQKQALAARDEQLKTSIRQIRQELIDYLAAPGGVDDNVVARIQKSLIAAQDEERRIRDSLKRDDASGRERPRERDGLLPADGIESIGGRLSGVDYNAALKGGETQMKRKQAEDVGSMATDVKWLRQNISASQNANFVGGSF